MTDSFADELNEQQMDTDSLFQALRYYLAELSDDLPAEDMLGEIRAAERDSQVDAELTRFERDSWLLEVAALRVLSSAWSDPAQRGAVRRALAEAKGKLPVIEVAILAIAAMYGMYLIATGGVKRTEKTYEREGTVYKEVTEYADPVDPLRSVTGLFAPPQSANSDQVESATDDSAP